MSSKRLNCLEIRSLVVFFKLNSYFWKMFSLPEFNESLFCGVRSDLSINAALRAPNSRMKLCRSVNELSFFNLILFARTLKTCSVPWGVYLMWNTLMGESGCSQVTLLFRRFSLYFLALGAAIDLSTCQNIRRAQSRVYASLWDVWGHTGQTLSEYKYWKNPSHCCVSPLCFICKPIYSALRKSTANSIVMVL